MYNVAGLITTNYATENLGALTKDRTVASLPFGSRYRLVDFPLSNMVHSGIYDVGVITPYKYRSIIDHIGSGKAWSLDHKSGGLFVLPGSVFGISSADARFILRDMERNKAFFIRNPTDYVLISSANTVFSMDYTDLIKTHAESGADVTLVYNEAAADNAFLNRITLEDERVVGMKTGVKQGEKAFLDCFIINSSLLINVLGWYKAINHLDIFEVLQDDFYKMDVRAFKFEGPTGSIFTVQDYFKHSMSLLNHEVSMELFNPERPVLTKPHDMTPTKYVEGTKVRNSLIPSGCVIAGEVEQSVIFGGCTVEEGAVVKNSILLQGCRVKAGAVVENAIVDRGNTISGGTVLKGTAENPLVIDKAEY